MYIEKYWDEYIGGSDDSLNLVAFLEDQKKEEILSPGKVQFTMLLVIIRKNVASSCCGSGKQIQFKSIAMWLAGSVSGLPQWVKHPVVP